MRVSKGRQCLRLCDGVSNHGYTRMFRRTLHSTAEVLAKGMA